MTFRTLDEPSIFLSSPGDVWAIRESIKTMFEDLRKQRPNKGIKLYAWESEISKSGFDQWRSATEQIPLPSDPFCKAVIFLFGERIGTPLVNAQAYRQYLGEDEILQPQGSKYHLELNWESGLEMSGGFPLTGTVFEMLVTLAANEEAKKNKRAQIPFKLFFIGDETLLSVIRAETDTKPEDANWGNRELFEKGRKGLKIGDFANWEKDYISQIRQLRNFIRYLIQRNVHIDEYSIVPSRREANEKCKDFLIKNLGYIEKTSNPFKGLKFYDFDDAGIFFGREGWLDTALEKFNKCWSPKSAPFYGIVGGSGVGKSSLLRAGVLARLKEKGYKIAIYQANDFLSRRNHEAVINKFSDTPLGVVVEKALHGIFEKQIVDESRDDDEKIITKIEDSDKKLVSQIIDDLTYTTPERRPHKAAEKIIAELDKHAEAEKVFPSDKLRLVIGLDQFEELLDYRTPDTKDANSKLDSLFGFFQEACKSGRIGFVYTCQNNRREKLETDEGLVSLVNSQRQDKVDFPTAYELAGMIERMFLHVDMTVSDAIVYELLHHVDVFAEDIRKVQPQVIYSEEIKATLLPLLSLTLLNFYEHYEKRRGELLQKQQDSQVKTMAAFANSVNKEAETAAASAPVDDAEPGRATRALSTDNDNMLFLELEDLSPDILNVENAIKIQADKALKDARESPGVNWLDDVFDALLRRLIRIHSELDGHYNLLSIAVPRRGAGKILVEKFRENRLLIPVGYDEVRLVHEAVITHWNEAKERVEKEKQLLRAYEKLTRSIQYWESENRDSTVLQPVNIEKLKLAGEFLRKWWDVFKPNDGTVPSRKDQLLCDFALAMLEAAMTPSGIVKADDYESTHFLTAVNYGRQELVRRYLEIEPTAAREHRTSKGANAAYCAASSDDLTTLDIVIENGASPTESNLEGWQAIHVAAHNGNIEILNRLMDKHVNPNAAGFFGRTPLHVAATNDQQYMVRHLLETYAVEANAGDTNDWTALHLACQSASTGTVRVLLDHESIDPSLITKDGWSALNVACRYGNADMVYHLLRNSLTDPTAIVNGWSPLHLAILNKSPDIIRALLQDERVDRTVETPTKKSVVEYAIEEANLEVLKALLDDPFKQVNPDATSANKGTPLFKACAEDKTELVRVLVNGGADVNDYKSQGRIPFLLMAERGNEKILKLLLRQANFAEMDSEGRTALHLAALKGHTQVVETLVQYINPAVRDEFGATPLHLAAEAGFIKTVEVFLKFSRELLDVADGLGRKLPHIAATHGYVQFLLELGEDFDADIRDAQGMNALHYAARFGKVDFLKHLLERPDVDPNARDDYGWTPLHLGAQNGRVAVVNLLLEKGADKSAPGTNPPLSPLLAAVAAGQTSMLELLIEEDAEPADYMTLLDEALFLAVKNAQYETALRLLTLHPRHTRL